MIDHDALPHLPAPIPGPRSRAWLQRLRAVESPNVTAMDETFPVVWQQARGALVWDVDGNRYLDAGSAFGVAFVGHGHPAVRAAAHAQVDALVHGMGDVHPPTARIELLEALAAATPGDLGHGVLCTGGSEAVEVALKTAMLATGKPGIVAFRDGYHGLTLGALGGTARADFRGPFARWVPGPTTFCDYATDAATRDRVLAEVEAALTHPQAPAGVVLIEPLQGRGGTRLPAPGLLAGLRALCDAHGALLCFDEIFTGCGRTGAMFACEHPDAGAPGGVLPDLLCVGKALGGGFPVSACLGRPQVMAAWGPSKGEALHTSTFLGHPVAAAAAVASLRAIREEGLVERAKTAGAALQAALRERLGGHPAVREIRGRGLMQGVDLGDGGLAWRVVLGCLQRGVLLLPCGTGGHVVQLTPPAVTTDAQLAFIVDTLAKTLTAESGFSA